MASLLDPPPPAFPVLSSSTTDYQTDLLRAIVEHTASANSLWAPVWNDAGVLIDFRYLYVNPAAARYLNQPNNTLPGRLVSEFNPQFQESGHAKLFADVYTTGIPFRDELMHPSLHRWLDLSVSRVGDVLLMSFNDIHERHVTNSRLQEQADLLQRVVNQSPSGMMLLEAIRDEHNVIIDFKYLLTNNLNAQMTGHTVEQMTGKTISALFPGYQTLDLFETLVQVTQSGEMVENTFTYDSYGVKETFEGYYVKQGDGVLFTFVNISRLSEQQQQLTQMNRELLRSNESLQQFAYIASHDLQEPLRKVQSFSKMLGEQYADQLEGTGLDMLTRVQSSARRMSELIRDLLNYARLTTEKELSVAVNLNTVLSDALVDLDIRIQETQPTIQVASLPVVHGRAVQLRQLFHNLLGNALKFQPPGQQPMIEVSCHSAESADLPADLPPRRTYWRIDVRDNGIGFHQQYTDRIFDVFQRLHGKNKFAGTGVGLAVCRRVAETHGGAIIASSKLGEGATFSVFLPK
ncbi:sensor histidine kinase [Fibrivirga algicola]|uniref:histidine kinase n=1 Tax=Fibrivirga algicola TaxID=2950420 RepID=A0ABX0QHL2_9BACT|nr:ATP-binding protein [Fibrivirga algicola]NID10442.1 PAS domain-containing protein [Fibrivirga algicola]